MRVLLLRVQEKVVILNPIEAYPTSNYFPREKPVILGKKTGHLDGTKWITRF
jgi:hypothetical protein